MAVREVTLAGLSREQLLQMHEQMVLLRRFEEKAAEEYTLGKIGGFLHLYIGQEANGVGAFSALKPEDYVLSAYREHGYAILKGMDPKAVMAELLGKATGVSKGKGGSMHMWSNEHHLLGGQAIVGGAARHGGGRRLRHPVPGRAAHRARPLRRRRGGRGRLPRGDEPLRRLEAPGRLHVREQPVLDGHGRHQSLVRHLAGAARRRLRHAVYKVDGMDVMAVREALL